MLATKERGIAELVCWLSRAPLRPPDCSHFAAASASAEELITAIGLKTGHAKTRWYVDRVQHLSGCRIYSRQAALVTFPVTVPEFSVDPAYAGDEAVGLNGANDRPCLWIDLVDFSFPILPNPERPFRPCEP